MAKYGKVTAITEEPVGTVLSAPAAAGDTQITVDDVTKLAWPRGGLQIGDDVTFETRVYSISAAPSEDIDVIDEDDGDDPDEGTIDLFSFVGAPLGLDNSYDVDTKVIQLPQVTEKIATVQLPDQEEELVLRVPAQLTDLLPTDIRVQADNSGTAETVELEESDSEYVITDVIDEQGSGFSRGYETNDGPVSVTTIDPLDPVVICSVPVEVPTTQHRLVVSYFARLDVTGANSVFLAFDDEGIDFPVGEVTLAIQNASTSSGVHDVLPLLGSQPQDTAYVRAGAIAITAGLQTLPTAVLPYTLDEPTVGLHNFRLVAYVDGGTGTVTDARMWAAVI